MSNSLTMGKWLTGGQTGVSSAREEEPITADSSAATDALFASVCTNRTTFGWAKFSNCLSKAISRIRVMGTPSSVSGMRTFFKATKDSLFELRAL